MAFDPQSPPENYGELSNDDRTWGMLSHLSPFVAVWLGGFGLLGPLVIWLIYKDKSAFVADQAKESLNFQIAVAIALFTAALSLFFCVGVVLLPLVVLFAWVYQVMGAIEANKGVWFRYPYTIRLIN